MRPLTLPLLGLLTLAPFAPLHAADPLAASLPENASVFLSVKDLTKLRQTKDHPLFKSLLTGEVAKSLDPVLKKLESSFDDKAAGILKEETGLTLEELLAKFPGGAAVSLAISLEKVVASGDTEETPDVATTLVADFTGDEALMVKILSALDKLEEQANSGEKDEDGNKEKDGDAEPGEEEEEDQGLPAAEWPEDYDESITEAGSAKLHEWTVRDPEKKQGVAFGWSVIGGKAALSLGKADLREMVGRLEKPTVPGSLAATNAWKTLPDSDKEADLLFGVNLESVFGQIQEGMRLKLEKGEMNTGLPINPLQVWTGMGLDQFQAAWISTTLEAEDAAVHTGMTYAEKPAVLKIYAATGPGTPPTFVPADVQEVAWGTLDWGKMFDNIKELAIAVSPIAAGGIEMGLGEAKKKLGVDLRADLLGQMGDDLWSVSQIDPLTDAEKLEKANKTEDDDAPLSALSALAAGGTGQSQVIGIALKDSKAVALSLKTVFNTFASEAALFDDREFMGHTIRQVKNTPPEMSVAWLIANDSLILSIGKPALLEKVLGGMAKKPANPLVSEPHVQAALSKLPEGAVSTSYADAATVIEAFITGMKGGFSSVTQDMESDENLELFSNVIKNLPDKPDLPWQIVSRSYLGDKISEVRVRLSNKP